MPFFEHAPLQQRNTFGLAARARYLALVQDENELAHLLRTVTARNVPLQVLGGGSNIVLAGDYPGMMLVPQTRGIRVLSCQGGYIVVEAMAGESWHGFVSHCLARGWFGLENLSLIPGTVGAAPIQNIGAYGVEVADRLHSVLALDRHDGRWREFSREQCRLSYRDSIFKQELRDRLVICRVRFRLSLGPDVQTGYGDIARELQRQGIHSPTPRDVAAAVIAIRRQKLPDPARLGNAGSFFKNPVVDSDWHARLRAAHPGLVSYPQPDGRFKLAAGWLIEQAGWKGRRLGAAGVHDRQALVLVNHGGATGADILALASRIQADVNRLFAVALEMEPVVIGAAGAD